MRKVIPLEATTMGDWAPWSSCSVSCGVGGQSRQRQCHQGTITQFAKFNAKNCDEVTEQRVEQVECKPRECPIVTTAAPPTTTTVKTTTSAPTKLFVYVKNQYVTVDANSDRVPQTRNDCDAWTYSMTIKDETHQLDINECISVYEQIQAKIAKKKTKPKFKAPSQITLTTKPIATSTASPSTAQSRSTTTTKNRLTQTPAVTTITTATATTKTTQTSTRAVDSCACDAEIDALKAKLEKAESRITSMENRFDSFLETYFYDY